MCGTFINLLEAISQILNDSSKDFLLGNLQLQWEKITGKTISSVTEPIKIEKKKLIDNYDKVNNALSSTIKEELILQMENDNSKMTY